MRPAKKEKSGEFHGADSREVSSRMAFATPYSNLTRRQGVARRELREAVQAKESI